MDVISRALTLVVTELIRTDQLLLVEGGDATLLVEEVLVHVHTAGGFAEAGGVIARALMGSSHVEELFASDREIVELLGEVEL